MKKSKLVLVAALAGIAAWAAPGTAAADAPAHAFVGVEKCKLCHNSPAKGAQFTKWSESAHSKAWAALASPEAKKVAAEKKIADPQTAPECLKCHAPGALAPKDKQTDKWKVEDGVGCESCHGPGGDYWKMDVMKDQAKAVAAGLVMPTEATCKTCHNTESPTFKGFDFKTALAKIAHPNPAKGAAK